MEALLGTRISPVWLRVLETDPELLVDRKEQLGEVVQLLEDAIDANIRTYRILVTGDRGIGKSIFSRAVLAELAKRRENAVTLHVSGRSIKFPRFLKDLAQQLVQKLKPLAASHGLERWIDELALLANNDRITRGQSQTIAKKYGAGSELKGGLFGVLDASSRFSWEENRSRGTTESVTQDVDASLVEAAIRALLERLAHTEIRVVALLDDLDQVDISDLKEAVKRVLDLEPMLALVHLRSEAVDDDIRRELKPVVSLDGLPPALLVEAILKRAAHSQQTKHLRTGNARPTLERLASVSGNALAYLTWVAGLFSTHTFPIEGNWASSERLVELLKRVELHDVDDELALRLAAVVERCEQGRDWVTRKQLNDGRCATDPSTDGKGLEDWEIEKLMKLGYLRPRNRYYAEQGFQMDPMLDLLRPSSLEKLGAG